MLLYSSQLFLFPGCSLSCLWECWQLSGFFRFSFPCVIISSLLLFCCSFWIFEASHQDGVIWLCLGGETKKLCSQGGTCWLWASWCVDLNFSWRYWWPWCFPLELVTVFYLEKGLLNSSLWGVWLRWREEAGGGQGWWSWHSECMCSLNPLVWRVFMPSTISGVVWSRNSVSLFPENSSISGEKKAAAWEHRFGEGVCSPKTCHLILLLGALTYLLLVSSLRSIGGIKILKLFKDSAI